ncbi:MAG TPA: hypothetical protein VF306_02555 [Pirellulales bacterium]
MPTEAILLMVCSATALTLISGVAWLVNRRQTRGRRRASAWSLAALRHRATSRQAVWSLGGVLLAVCAVWWATHWHNRQTPADGEKTELTQGVAGEGGNGEVVAFDASIDPAARQKMLAERWQRGLPLLAIIGLAVAAWVGLAHSGLLEQRQRSRVHSVRTRT